MQENNIKLKKASKLSNASCKTTGQAAAFPYDRPQLLCTSQNVLQFLLF